MCAQLPLHLEASALRQTSPAACRAGNSPDLHEHAKVKLKSWQGEHREFQEGSPWFMALKMTIAKAFRYQRIWQWDYHSN